MPNERYLAPKPGASALSALFYGRMKVQEVKCSEMEDALCISACTLRKYLQHPDGAPLNLLKKICKYLGISKSEFCMAMEWRTV